MCIRDRYQGYLYPDMETCLTYTEMYVEQFRSYAESQGDTNAHFDSMCFETESYPIEGLNDMKKGIGFNA